MRHEETAARSSNQAAMLPGSSASFRNRTLVSDEMRYFRLMDRNAKL